MVRGESAKMGLIRAQGADKKRTEIWQGGGQKVEAKVNAVSQCIHRQEARWSVRKHNSSELSVFRRPMPARECLLLPMDVLVRSLTGRPEAGRYK